MVRSIAVLCGILAVAPAVSAGDLPVIYTMPPQQLVIVNYPSAALQTPAGGTQKTLPTITNLQAVAGLKAADPSRPANAPTAPRALMATAYAPTYAVVDMPFTAPYAAPSAFDYAPGYGYGYAPPYYGYAASGYGLGYGSLNYNAGYTVAYDYWAQPRPLAIGVMSPAGTISTAPSGGVVSLAPGYIVR